MDLSFEIPRTKSNQIFRNKINDEMFDEICSLTPFIEDTSRNSLRERVFCIEHGYEDFPKCPVCGSAVKWNKTSGNYPRCCSISCGQKNPSTRQIMATNSFEKYGVKCPQQTSAVKERMKNTCLIRFGVEATFQSQQIKEKSKQTNLEKYGVEHPKQLKWFNDEIEQNNLLKYGVPFPQQTKEIRDKISISLAKNYKSRRNEADDDYSGIVYFLYFPELEAVKIGLTADLKTRFKGLKKDFGEFSVIKLIETEGCSKLESYFHEKFDEYRICLEEGSGRTEFFREEILKELNDIS